MSLYLLDTNICIYFLKGLFDLNEKIKKVGTQNCFISEITVAEMKFGVQNSVRKEQNQKKLDELLTVFKIIPIYPSLDIYAEEKARLRKSGQVVDDFDLLIGATAIFNEMTLVTKNTKHFKRMNKINIEDWTEIKD